MAQDPMIGSEDRPDLTIDLESWVGDLTVRQLSEILGQAGGSTGSSAAQLKQAAPDKLLKEDFLEKFPGKEFKDVKDNKERKEQKDHKEPKDQKDQKELKDHKEPKDQKDQKEHKDHKDQKDSADNKAQKDHKENKDHKDQKDRKEDLKDGHKEFLKEFEKVIKDQPEGKLEAEGPGGPVAAQPGLDELLRRVSGLEQEVSTLRRAGSQG